MTLPQALKLGIDELLECLPRADLAKRAAKMSENYRGGGTSSGISRHDDALAYMLTRLPATYAAVAAALKAMRQAMPDFIPRSLLDVGAGPGTASWAACEIWPGIDSLALLDRNSALLALGEPLLRAAPYPALCNASILRQNMLTARLPEADLVILSYALNEIACEEQSALVDRLWRAAKIAAVVIEPGTPAGYGNIIRARDAFLRAGAAVAAPCPHNLPCPIAAPDWCHFSQRLPRSRDHIKLKNASVPFEDEKFSYVAVSRLPVARAPQARVLAPPRIGDAAVTCKLCVAAGGIVTASTPRRDRQAYRALAKTRWGAALD